MDNQPNDMLAQFQESGVIISDDKKENDTKVSVLIDAKMVHLKAIDKKNRFDRIIPIRQVASCEVHHKSNNALRWFLRIAMPILLIICVSNDWTGGTVISVFLFIASFFIPDNFHVEITASNGKPIKCKFEAKNKNDDVNDRFVSIVRKLICEVQ